MKSSELKGISDYKHTHLHLFTFMSKSVVRDPFTPILSESLEILALQGLIILLVSVLLFSVTESRSGRGAVCRASKESRHAENAQEAAGFESQS